MASKSTDSSKPKFHWLSHSHPKVRACLTCDLPDDPLVEGTRRLRILALLFAFAFFMANFFPALVAPDWARGVFADISGWAPGVTSIAVALVVFWLTTRPKISPKTLMNVGVVFEIVGSFGIAMAQYWGVYHGLEHNPDHLEIFGVSWVAVWMLLFTIVVPMRPRRALLAAIASASSVPIVMAMTMRYGGTSIELTPMVFFVGLILPYIIIVIMAYAGARVVYQLGSDVSRARDLGSYRLVKRLGQGGMGEVWRAEHRMLARPAAIKLVRPEMLGDTAGENPDVILKRFEREAQATAQMHSPHTISVYDFGISGEGTFYYVMELLDGFDLESFVRQFGPLPAERVIHLLCQACDSLGEAHEAGLIHRDVKPANMFVCRYGRDVDFIKVLDFGLVKPRHATGEADLKLTADNIQGGTPAYIAPEQVLTGSVDARTDIYCLGCVAYWLLTGQLVFKGATALQTLVQHVQAEPVPPSHRTELEIPTSLEDAILSCLEKDPDQRPQDVDMLSELLGSCTTRAQWSTERAREWWDLHQPPTEPVSEIRPAALTVSA
ncbi:MAG: serine/threonine protein kinase [Gemmatimonadales bacterium]|nr:serine/threonine protein kinase [Gemmatimonadales bacterium]